MKQILQDARSGSLELVEVPAPAPGPGEVLVSTRYSVVSPGTEKMAMDFARKSLLGKARSRPDLVNQVARKLRQEGPLPTYRAVTTRLSAPQPLGYSSAGVVLEAGPRVTGFAPGDRVACAGAGYANHAELAVVPENLVARVPDDVSLEHAAYATVGAIALQGLRVANPTLGESVAVIGLGLIGQLAVQLLTANGCRVLGIDPDPTRAKQSLSQGARWAMAPDAIPATWKDEATGGHGVDFALITASANDSAPIQLAADLCRMKGRLSLVGAMPMDLDRRSFYEKELELRLSMSYGPGRYERRYEEGGLDYPLPFVRWTENRNLTAFLDLIETGALNLDRLDADVVAFEDAERTYEELAAGERRTLSVVFRYREDPPRARSIPLETAPPTTPRGHVGVAFLGAGNYAKGILLPAVKSCGNARRIALVTQTGASARRTGEQFDFASCSTDATETLARPDVDLVFVATRHDSHAELGERALRAGKAVWLEKPAALSPVELASLLEAARESHGFLAVGYNRRFSSHARAARQAFADTATPLSVHYSVAAGAPPANTWITDPLVGGGRIVGEACHFVDLCNQLTASLPESVYARSLGSDPEIDDSTLITVGYANGSTAVIEYLARTSADLPKERFEVSGGGRTVRCENFRTTAISGARTLKTLNQDKGQRTAVAEVIEAVRSGGRSPFTLEEIAAVSTTTFAVLESIQTGRVVRVAP